MKKGIVLPFLLILASVAFILSAFFLLGDKPKTSDQQSIQQASPSPEIDTTNWKTYENKEFGISFKHPKDWEFGLKPLQVFSRKHIELLADGEDPGGICRFPCHKGDLTLLKTNIEKHVPMNFTPYLRGDNFINVDNHQGIQNIWYDTEGGVFLITTSIVTKRGLFVLSQDLKIDPWEKTRQQGIESGSQAFVDYNLQLATKINEGKINDKTKLLINIHHKIISTFKFTDQSNQGKFCGGIAGIACPTDYNCSLDGNYPDAGGKCVKK